MFDVIHRNELNTSARHVSLVIGGYRLAFITYNNIHLCDVTKI